jgi:predicted nucleic acid-binding protein
MGEAAVDRTGMIQKRLNEAELRARSDELAQAELDREALLEKKRSHNREWNEKLRQFRETIRQLSTEVNTGEAWVSAQAELYDAGHPFVDEPAAKPAKPAKKRASRRAKASNDNAVAGD